MSYLGQEPGLGSAERFVFTATAVTDTVTADDNGVLINYTAGQVSVYLNGVKQVIGDDIETPMNGSSIVFASDYAIGDVIEVIALSTFSPADTVPATGGSFTGNVTLPSPIINTGVSGSAILDEDAMSSNSDTKLATQQSIKAYADLKAPKASPIFTGVTTAPSLVLTPGSAPATTEGAIYYDSTTNLVKIYNGVAWENLTTYDNAGFTGGVITSISSGGVDYKVHTISTSTNFIALSTVTIEYLMVAGGGGGGTTSEGQAGGGGAGGVLTNYGGTAISLAAGTYPVVIGGGGAVGTSGDNSTFNSLSATGGGYGGAFSNTPAASGGSGGGGHQVGTANVGGAGTGSGATRQGYAGGTSACSPNSWGGGGGGGYGSTGFAPTQADCRAGGNGGSPLTSTISGASETYAGGGGGSSHIQTSPTSGVGLGGNSSVTANKGGGGDGGYSSTAATAGVDGTGGGGGGGTDLRISAAGGDGIVIIRYAI